MLSLVEITAIRLNQNFQPMRALEFIRDHVTFKLPYDFSYYMKNPYIHYSDTSIKNIDILPLRPKDGILNRGIRVNNSTAK